MSTNISNNYSQFYKGTQTICNYGTEDAAVKKDTLVRYEFNTMDENGNKIMDKMSKEETIRIVNEISSQYGENVLVQFSGDGLAALAEAKKGQAAESRTQEQQAAAEAKNAAFQNEIVQMENTHRIVIPNAETNEQLYNSLEGADDAVIRSAMGIISNYLMPDDVSGMSEQERQDMAAFGLEEAKYIAENYLDEAHADDFMTAMETIVKYGLNGSVSENGSTVYSVQEGQVHMSGAPDSYVDMESWLKANDADLYNQINELNQSIVNHKDGESHSAAFIELYTKAAKEIWNASSGEAAESDYADWRETVEKTELPETFQNVSYHDFRSFLESLQNQSSLSNTWLSENISRFMKWLEASGK